MKKKFFIIHGWGANPQDDWFPWLKKEFDAEIIIEHNKGHFNASDKVVELPIVLESILEMSK